MNIQVRTISIVGPVETNKAEGMRCCADFYYQTTITLLDRQRLVETPKKKGLEFHEKQCRKTINIILDDAS